MCGLARGAGLFDGNELAQAVVVVAAAEDLADEGVDLGAGVRQAGVLQRLQACGAQGREAAQAVPLALHLQGVLRICCGVRLVQAAADFAVQAVALEVDEAGSVELQSVYMA